MLSLKPHCDIFGAWVGFFENMSFYCDKIHYKVLPALATYLPLSDVN